VNCDFQPTTNGAAWPGLATQRGSSSFCGEQRLQGREANEARYRCYSPAPMATLPDASRGVEGQGEIGDGRLAADRPPVSRPGRPAGTGAA
jgi:hypothetical protein